MNLGIPPDALPVSVGLTILLAAAGALALALVVLVALPLNVMVLAATSPRRRVTIRAVPLAGRGPSIPIWDSAEPEAKKVEKPARDAGRKPRAGGRPWARHLPRLALAILEIVEFRTLRVAGRFGCADPADTGFVFGCLTPLRYALGGAGRSVDIVPDFGAACLSGEAEATLTLRPAALVPPLARFGWAVYRAGPGAERAR